MSRFDEPQFEPLLELLRAHIRKEKYGVCARAGYPYAARSFLRYLERRGRALESVTPADLERYLNFTFSPSTVSGNTKRRWKCP
jgi:hypothetical protein